MRSIVCKINSIKEDRADILKEVENFAEVCQFDKKQVMHLRLLSEELVGMASSLLEIESGSFWIEKKAKSYEVYLQAEADIGEDAKKRLLAAATSGKDYLHQGVTGKILRVYEWFIEDKAIDAFTPEELIGGMVSIQEHQEWSLKMMRKSKILDKKAQSWDELERSVLGKLADDIRVSVSAKKLKVVITKEL